MSFAALDLAANLRSQPNRQERDPTAQANVSKLQAIFLTTV